jgi:hypothetical protein
LREKRFRRGGQRRKRAKRSIDAFDPREAAREAARIPSKKTGRQKRLEAISPLKVATPPFFAGDKNGTFFWGLLDAGHPISLSAASSIAKNRAGLLTFALYSPNINVCANACHAQLAFGLLAGAWPQRMRPSSSALVLEWNRALRDKFVQPGCTVTANRIPSEPGRPILS